MDTIITLIVLGLILTSPFLILIFRNIRFWIKGLPPGFRFYRRNGDIIAAKKTPGLTEKGFKTKTGAIKDAWWDYNYDKKIERRRKKGEWSEA